MGSPTHVMLCACEAQEDDRQERGHAHSQSAMSKADDIADRRPLRVGASIPCLGLPFYGGFMKTKGIFLTWIVVKNLEEAIQFYTKAAKLELKEYHKEYRWAELAGPEGMLLGIGEENSTSPVKSGVNAVVTISVDNIEKAKAHMLAQGVSLIGDTLEIPGHVKMQTFIDTDGNTLQLVEQL